MLRKGRGLYRLVVSKIDDFGDFDRFFQLLVTGHFKYLDYKSWNSLNSGFMI